MHKTTVLVTAFLLSAGDALAAEGQASADGPKRAIAESQAGTATVNPQVAGEPRIGNVTGCQMRPPFMRRLKVPEDARISTGTPGLLGFNILMRDPQTGRIRPLVHDTWKSAGNLGQFTYDRHGNIYLVPVPLTSLETNPLQDQNKVYVIDADTGRMGELIDLPAPKPLDTTNPFGTIGLAYDCETHSLYVASIAGSSPAEELGIIFRIDLGANQVASRLDGVDALGLGVLRGSMGKRLYFGAGRAPEVHSIALDEQGAFQGEPRLELDLGDLNLPSTYRAQKIRFTSRAGMRLKALPFAYSLRLTDPKDIVTRMLHHLPGDGWEVRQPR